MKQTRETAPADLVYARAARLLAVQHAVAEIAGGRKVDADPAALRDAVRLIQKITRGIDGAYAVFIGGLAVQQHGYERWTDDLDVVVDAAHFGEVLDKLRAAGFVLKADFTLQNRQTGAKVDFLKEGNTLKNGRFPLPHPRELGPNGGFVGLPWLIRLKLDAHRRQDLADVVQIMKTHLPETAAIAAELPDVYKTEFHELADEARRELAP